MRNTRACFVIPGGKRGGPPPPAAAAPSPPSARAWWRRVESDLSDASRLVAEHVEMPEAEREFPRFGLMCFFGVFLRV